MKDFSASNSSSPRDPAPSTHVHLERPVNPEELVLKTRLCLGKISYDEKDVEVRLDGWTAPQRMVENLLRDWYTVNDAELSIYRGREIGKERIVVTRNLKSRGRKY